MVENTSIQSCRLQVVRSGGKVVLASDEPNVLPRFWVTQVPEDQICNTEPGVIIEVISVQNNPPQNGYVWVPTLSVSAIKKTIKKISRNARTRNN